MAGRRLGISLDGIAVLRQSRRSDRPDPVATATVAELAGASLVVAHLREDRAHIQERDVRLLRQTAKTPLSLRMTGTQEMLKLAYDIKPDEVILVPEIRDELGTEVGLDVNYHKDNVRKWVHSLRDGDIGVRAFISADIEQIRAAHRIDLSSIVLDTGKFCTARGAEARAEPKQRLADAARAASKLGIAVAMSNGLNYHNIQDLLDIDEVEEFHVGHSIISQSITTGLDQAVRDMVRLIGT